MMTNVIKKNFNLHLLSLIIFSIYYLFSLFLFDAVVINPHDNLDIEVVLDHVILKILKGNFESYKVFLAGEFKWYYLDRIFYPINIFHIFLSDYQFYFFKEILEKLISYFSFYLLGKFLFKNKIYSIFGALIYTTLTNDISHPPSTLFLPFAPYLLYLLISKDQFELKHYVALFFIGLNSSLVFDYMSMILILFFSSFVRPQINFKILINFLIMLSLAMLISGIPLILSVLAEPLHRTLVEKESILNITILEFKNFFEILLPRNVNDFFSLPSHFLKLLIITSGLLLNNKKINLFIVFIVSTYLLKILLSSDLTQIFFNNFLTFLKGFNFSRAANILPLLFSILLVAILRFYKKKFLKNSLFILTILSAIFSQVYFPINEYSKEFLKENLKSDSLELVKKNYKDKKVKDIILIAKNKKNYKYENLNYNLKTKNSFNSYYNFETYKKIKTLVGSNRVASVGVDPMIAAMNDINIIDGYHSIYSLSYKKKFRKIIEDELNANETIKDYYDLWGNRVYMFYSDKNNLLINFEEAKNLGAAYIISSFPIKNKYLETDCLICGDNSKIYLYKII